MKEVIVIIRWMIQKVRLTWFLDYKNNHKVNTVWNWKFSNSLKVIGIVIRKGVNGIDVIVWIKIVNVEGREKEKIVTIIPQQPSNWNKIEKRKEQQQPQKQ